MNPALPSDSGLVPVPDNVATATPVDNSGAGILPPGTTLHAADPGTGVTHVKGPTGTVVPVATSILKPADHAMLGTPQAAPSAPTPAAPKVAAVAPQVSQPQTPAPQAAKPAAPAAPAPASAPDTGVADTRSPKDPNDLSGTWKTDAGQDSSAYDGQILTAGTKYGVEPNFLKRVIETESRFNPKAVSPTGATGLGQFVQKTWDAMGGGDRTDPDQSIDHTGKLLGSLLKKYNGRKDLALAAYNVGEHAVDAAKGIPAPFTVKGKDGKDVQIDPKAYATQILGGKAAGATDAATSSSSSSDSAAPAPLAAPSADEIENAKNKPMAGLGQLIRTVEDPKTGARIVTMLGRDGKVHDFNFDALPADHQKNITDKFGVFGGQTKAPSWTDKYITGPAKAAAAASGHASDFGISDADADQAQLDHPIGAAVGRVVRSTQSLTPTESITGPLGYAEAVRRGLMNDSGAPGIGVSSYGGLKPLPAPAAVPPAAASAEISPQPAAPTASPASTTTPQPVVPAPTPAAEAAPAPINTNAQQNAADDHRAAIGSTADAESAQSDAMAGAMKEGVDQAVSDNKNLDAAYKGLSDDERQAFHAQMGVAADLYRKAAVNPNTLWANASTGQKVLGGIGLMFSNVGASFLGTTPVDLISKAQDRDIQIQQNAFRNAQRAGQVIDNAYGHLRQAGMSDVEAAHAIRLAGLETAKAHVMAIAQASNSPVIQAKSKENIAALDERIANEQVGMIGLNDEHRIRTAQAKRLELGNQQAENPQPAPTDARNTIYVKGNAVQLPAVPGKNGNPDAAPLKLEIAGGESAFQNLDALKQASRGTGSSFKGMPANDKVQGIKTALYENIGAAFGGKDTPAARSMIKQLDAAMDPKTFQTQAGFEAGIDAIRDAIQQKLDARFKGAGLKPYSTFQSPADAQLQQHTTQGNFTPIS